MAGEPSPCHCDQIGHCPWHKAITTPTTIEACKAGNPPPATNPEPCIYLGKATETTRRRVDQIIYECRQHGLCVLNRNRGGLPACVECKQNTKLDANISNTFVDPLYVTERDGKPTHALRNMLVNGAAFLVCGGPSVNEIEFKRLGERGIFSLGINNVAGYVPTTAFICSDPPSKFHSSIFLDPKVFKFLPIPKLKGNRGGLRKKVGDEFIKLDRTTSNCPNTWGFERRSWLACDSTWFTEPSAAWGNHEVGVRKTGEQKTVNTMFLGLRMLQYLGAKHIFLLGVDFHMEPTRPLDGNYAFGEHRDHGAIESNNRQYQTAAGWLTRLRPVFEQFGFHVFNCNRHSSLRAFDYVPFDKALEICRGQVAKEPFDLKGWYVK